LTVDEVKIRDLSRPNSSEWTPPIGAMGGPPAHELYRDLVAHGGLRLLRDREGSPWVEMQDGTQRRSFRVPGMALRGALDRFRMRRNLRPVPETDLEDFTRVVGARISDPDVHLPTFEASSLERAPVAPEPSYGLPPLSGEDLAPDSSRLEAELAQVLREVDEVRADPALPSIPAAPSTTPSNAPWAPWQEDPPAAVGEPRSLGSYNASISGAGRAPAGEESLPRYLRVLRGLAAGGGWLGTLGELGRMTREDPDAVFGSLLKYHSQLTQNHLVVAPVEVEDGWRWLVIDRSRLRTSEAPPPETVEPGIPGAPGPETFT
jgi:hypothetical protein